MLLLALLAATGEDVAHLDDENKILAATWNRERRLWRQKLEYAGLPHPFLDDAVDFIQGMHVLRTLGGLVDRRSELSPYLRMYFDKDDLQGDAASIIKRALCPRRSCALDAIAPDPLADWVTYTFCMDHESILDWLENVFSPGDSVARAAFVFHRLLALSFDLHIEEELILRELCKWADRRLAPHEIPPLLNAFRTWMVSIHIPTDEQNPVVRSMLAFRDGVPETVLESVSEIETIDCDILNIIQLIGVQE